MATAQQQTIRRGTTPDIVINVKNADLSDKKVELTLDSNGYQVVHTTDDRLVVVVEEVPSEQEAADDEEVETMTRSVCHTKLTQEETLAFKANSKLNVQIRICDKSGNAPATAIFTLGVEDILRNGKISYS